jgi:AcrR family transcriptional regulator
MQTTNPADADERRVLPRGRHSLPRHVVQASQQERILRAITELVAEQGYGATSVAGIVKRAGVSRKAFYEHWSDKEDCFVAACRGGYERRVGAVVAATRALPGDATPQRRVRAAVHAYLEFMAREPEQARTMIVEVLGAGPPALQGRSEIHQQFARMTRAWHEHARAQDPAYPPVPESAYTASVAAIYGLVADRVAESRTGTLLELEDEIAYMMIALFLGHPAADAELPGVSGAVAAT